MKGKGVFFTILSAMLFGLTPILASLSYDLGSNAETLTFYRNLMTVPVFAVILAVRRTSVRLPGRVLGQVCLVALLGTGLTTLLLYSAYPYIGVGMSTSLHFLFPICAALICRLLFGERLGGRKVLALLVATVGVFCFLERGESSASVGIILALISAVTYASYMVAMEKLKLSERNPLVMSFYIAIVVALEMLVYNLFVHRIVFDLPPLALLYTFIISMCTSLVGVCLLQLGIRYLHATTAAILSLFEPLSSTVGGILILHEEMNLRTLAGSLLILAGIVLMVLQKEPEENPSERKALEKADDQTTPSPRS